jgi:cytosine permease
MGVDKQQWRDLFGDYALVPVPDENQRTMLNVFLVYSGVLAVISVIATGATLGLHHSVSELAVIAVAGSLILIVIGCLTAYIGGLTGLSTYVILRYPFGFVGGWVWGIVVSGLPAGIGWYSVQAWLFGITINALAPPGSVWADVGVAAIWGGALMTLTAIIGYRGLSFLSYLAVPMFILLAIAGFMVGIDATGSVAGIAELTPEDPGPGLAAGITAVVGGYIVAATITADIGRYGRKRHYAVFAWAVQILVLMPLMVVGAGIITLATGQSDFAQAMLAAGMGLGVFLIVIFGFWTTNDNNLYSGALAWSTFLPLKKRVIVGIQGVIGTAIAAYVGFSAGVSMDPFITFLEVLGVTVPAIAGVIIADFYGYRWWKGVSLRDRYAYEPEMEFGVVNWPGWTAAILGSAIGGFVMTVGIGSLNVFVLAVVFYLVLAILADVVGVPNEFGETQINETGRSPELLKKIPGGGRMQDDAIEGDD